MDVKILSKKGINPSNLRRGCLYDYALKIGNRASLIPSKNEKTYGILMTMDSAEIKNLYAETSVADYFPEDVNIIINTKESIKAICYILPSESLSGTNVSYAVSLYKLAKQENFPHEYLEKIKKMTL
jgi:hypothetical protein